MALTPEQIEYYDALEEMFTTKGWAHLIEDATAQIYQYQADALEQPSWDAVNILKGKAISLAELVNFENVSLMQKGLLELDDDEDDADV